MGSLEGLPCFKSLTVDKIRSDSESDMDRFRAPLMGVRFTGILK